MLEYIKDTFGCEIEEIHFTVPKEFPLYLKKDYQYELCKIMGYECLLVKPLNFNMTAYKKQKEKISTYAGGKVVLNLDKITTYQRKILIENRIPFVVNNNQIYMPFLGLFLSEKFAPANKLVEKFTPATQLVFLYLLYNNIYGQVTATDVAKILDIPIMTVNRAFNNLVKTNIFMFETIGKKKLIKLNCSINDVMKKADKYLQNPIDRTIIVENNTLLTNYCKAGIYALCEKTMLAESDYDFNYAVYKNVFKDLKNSITLLEDDDKQTPGTASIELWNYDPQKLAHDNLVDDISLILSLSDNKDDRIQIEIIKIREKYSW